MKVLNVDRKYHIDTGKKTYECFLTFDDGTTDVCVFPDYPVGSTVTKLNGRFYLEDIDRTPYESDELAEEVFLNHKANAEFFYKMMDVMSYEQYAKTTREIRNVARLFKENPYIICEKTDIDGVAYADFIKLDKIVNIKSFDTRLKELKMMAMYVLNQNEQEGHTWMPYNMFEAKFLFLLEQSGHPLLKDYYSEEYFDASAILNYFSDFYIETPFSYESKVAKTSTRNCEYYIERLVRGYFSADTIYRRFRLLNTSGNLTTEQTDAVKGTILSRGRFSILTGGPGVGKTTTIAEIVDGMKASYPDVVIRLLAPTGKASKRIEEQLGDREVEVSTIHKFIGYGKTFVTKEDVEEIKKSGLVVIDESSMMDVEIFRQLLSKLDMENTKVILVGDENQLPSIGAGNVLHDLIKMGVPTFRLTINHRNSGLIHTNAQKVISGEIGLESDEHFVVDERSPKMAWVFAGTDINNDSIVVPYHKEDKIGSVPQVNAIAQERHRLASRQGAKYNIGDVVICTRNNYRNGYLNGDVGHYKGRVDECHEILIGNKTVSVLDSDLELGYAITIHKSQGSEYPVMSICLPEYSPFISRKMLYTAITRAKHKLIIYAKHTVINRIILNNKDDERRTFLGILL